MHLHALYQRSRPRSKKTKKQAELRSDLYYSLCVAAAPFKASHLRNWQMARTTQQVMNDLRGPLLLHSHQITLQVQVQRVVSTPLFQVAKISSSILSLSSLDKSNNNRANTDPAKCTRNAMLKGSIPWSGCVQACRLSDRMTQSPTQLPAPAKRQHTIPGCSHLHHRLDA